ncbi:hypothetical protein Q1695_003763 [Nippostrongylus brasiliensis]|nr:hypothetical protein Q1695_003763 [Nippostrongylus brasiliensis]
MNNTMNVAVPVNLRARIRSRRCARCSASLDVNANQDSFATTADNVLQNARPQVAVLTAFTPLAVYSETCGKNEQYNECGSACEPSCKNPKPVCTRQCVVDVCQCKQAFIRDKKGGACISVDDCPKDPIKPCSEMNCPYGTTCELGRVICPFVPPCFTQQTRCVPNNSEYGDSESLPTATTENPCNLVDCMPNKRCILVKEVSPGQETCLTKKCPTGQECQEIALNCFVAPCPPPPVMCVPKEAPNPCAATTCLVGSECRVKNVQCIRAPCDPVAECYTPPGSKQCRQNETFKECSSQCEPTCSNKTPICILSCGTPKCQCSTGFFRHSNGKCVTEADCDASTNTNPY